MKTKIVHGGAMGSIMKKWLKLAFAGVNSIASQLLWSVRSIAVKSVSIVFVKLEDGIVALKEHSLQIQAVSRRVSTDLPLQSLRKDMDGKVMLSATMHYMNGLKNNWVNRVFVNCVELLKAKYFSGLTNQRSISETWPTGNDFVLNAI